MFLIRSALVNLWLFTSCAIGLFWGLYRWRDLNLNRDVGRLFGDTALKIARIELVVEGRENLEGLGPCVIVANHQHGIDVATFGSLLPDRTIGIGKKELIWIPFFGIYFIAAGNVMIDRARRSHAMAGLGRAVDAMRRRGARVFIFPEGTRNKSHQPMLPFKKGAFHMAVDAQVPILPIVSGPVKKMMKKGGRLHVRILPPIPTEGLRREDVDRLSAETRAKMLEAFLGLERSLG